MASKTLVTTESFPSSRMRGCDDKLVTLGKGREGVGTNTPPTAHKFTLRLKVALSSENLS